MIKKLSEEQGQKLQPNHKCFVTAKAYLSATFGQNISDFHFRLHWASLVHDWDEIEKYTRQVGKNCNHDVAICLSSGYLNILDIILFQFVLI